MFRSLVFSSFLALSLGVSSSAFADDDKGLYVNVGATLLTSELDLNDIDVQGQVVDFGTEDTDFILINGRLGYQINKYFAVEGEIGFGVSGDSVDRNIPVDVLGQTVGVDTTVDLDIDNYYIGFARAIYPVSDKFDIFARIGYGEASVSGDAVGSFGGITAMASADEDESGVAFGVGAQFNLDDQNGIRGDYTRLEDTNIISLSYTRKF